MKSNLPNAVPKNLIDASKNQADERLIQKTTPIVPNSIIRPQQPPRQIRKIEVAAPSPVCELSSYDEIGWSSYSHTHNGNATFRYTTNKVVLSRFSVDVRIEIYIKWLLDELAKIPLSDFFVFLDKQALLHDSQDIIGRNLLANRLDGFVERSRLEKRRKVRIKEWIRPEQQISILTETEAARIELNKLFRKDRGFNINDLEDLLTHLDVLENGIWCHGVLSRRNGALKTAFTATYIVLSEESNRFIKPSTVKVWAPLFRKAFKVDFSESLAQYKEATSLHRPVFLQFIKDSRNWVNEWKKSKLLDC